MSIKHSGSFKKGQIPWNKGLSSPLKGVKRALEIGNKISETKLNKHFHHTEETRKLMSLNRTGIAVERLSGKWIEDRTKLKRYGDDAKDRRSYAYTYWRQQVWLRDNFACKIANPDCSGRIEAHHILGWNDYPELRYQLNNGITLCHFHHPKVRKEEKRLSPYFQDLVSVSKV